jgi:hypothetical protein
MKNEIAHVAGSILESKAPSAEFRQQVRERQAMGRRVAGVGFCVKEVATGKIVGDGRPMPFHFAVYVKDVIDSSERGRYVVKRTNTPLSKD